MMLTHPRAEERRRQYLAEDMRRGLIDLERIAKRLRPAAGCKKAQVDDALAILRSLHDALNQLEEFQT